MRAITLREHKTWEPNKEQEEQVVKWLENLSSRDRGLMELSKEDLEINIDGFYGIDDIDTSEWDDLNLDTSQISTDGAGVLDGKTIPVPKPNRMRFTVHTGSTDQRADNTLVTIANGVKFPALAIIVLNIFVFCYQIHFFIKHIG